MGTGILRIEGGYVGVDARELVHAWRACLGGAPGVGGFRAWLAAREMVVRRQGPGGRRPPVYDVAELARLLGVSTRTATASIRRLAGAGLLSWSEREIAFPAACEHDQGNQGDVLADSIGGGQGPVAIPRRLLRFLARGARPALIATALSALLRCLSRRRSGFDARGRFKSSWVARLFGVAERHARSARAELVRLGWLQPEPGDQWAMNRWGRVFRVRLDWPGPDADRPTPTDDPGAGSSYPDHHPESLLEEEHPDPARPGPAGASLGREEGRAPTPNLRDIRSEDLVETGRTLELHRQAVERGVITASERDRVRFVAAIEHARAVGKANPPGLLARIVEKGWWHLVTQGDEDRAVRRLREHRRPTPPVPAPKPAPAPPPTFRSPYAQERATREPSSLGDLLARLAKTLD